MPLFDVPEILLGSSGLDDLDLFRQGLISQELLDLPQNPAKYVDPEGAPVACLAEDGRLQWIAPRSNRPYEPWHTGTTALTTPVALVDQQQDLIALPKEIATIVVLASTEASWVDRELVRLAKQRAVKGNIQLVVLPLGSKTARRSEKLAQVRSALQHLVEVADYTSADLTAHEPDGPGLVVFFTGLSGSGKSTLARALSHRLIEAYGLEVSLLDGDVVRRNLSHGLSFSVADRNANVRRIGWVAAEIARHGGIAVACPIAPFEVTRSEVKQMVTERGGRFLLVHVATPLEECERRDRKGLYARARAGKVPDFTGISSPYEPPGNADLRLDTTTADVDTLRDAILKELEDRGWLTTPPPPMYGAFS